MSEAVIDLGPFFGTLYCVGLGIAAASALWPMMSPLIFGEPSERRLKNALRALDFPKWRRTVLVDLFGVFYGLVRACIGIFGGVAFAYANVAVFEPHIWWAVACMAALSLVCAAGWWWLRPYRLQALRELKEEPEIVVIRR